MFFISEKEKLSWAIGFFEGEGCISVHSTFPKTKTFPIRPYYNLRLTLTNTDFDSVEYFHSVVGCGKLSKVYQRKDKKHKPIKTWVVCGPKAKELLLRFYPYLSARRRAKAEDCFLKLFQNTAKPIKFCQICGGKYYCKNYCHNHYEKFRRDVKRIGKYDENVKIGRPKKTFKVGA